MSKMPAPLSPRQPLRFEPEGDSSWMVNQRFRALELAVGIGGSDDQILDRAARFADFTIEARAPRWNRGLLERLTRLLQARRRQADSGELG